MQIPRTWLVCVLALAACGGKKDEKGGSGSGDKPTSGKTGTGTDDNKPLGGVEGGKIIGRTGDDIAMLPKDSEIIGGLNVSQVQLGGLWKDFVVPMIMKDPAKLEEFKTTCGFDPMSAVKSLSFGLKGLDTNARNLEGAVVVHGIDKAKGTACLDAMKAKGADKGVTLTKDGDVLLLVKDSASFAITWTDDTTAIVAGPHGSKDALLALTKGDDTLRGAEQVVAMYKKLNANDSMWFLLKGTSKIVEQASAVGIKPLAVFGTVNVGNDLQADIYLRHDKPEEAQKATGALTSLAGPAKNFAPIDRLDVIQDGLDVRVQAMMSNEHVKQMQNTLRGGPPQGGSGAAPAAPATP